MIKVLIFAYYCSQISLIYIVGGCFHMSIDNPSFVFGILYISPTNILVITLIYLVAQAAIT